MCVSHAGSAEDDYQQFIDQGFLIITLLAEDAGGQPADAELSERWADRFGLTFPVLADPGWGESNKYEQDFGIPTFHLLGRDLTIRILDGYVSEQAIQDALDEPIPEVPWEAPPTLEELGAEPPDHTTEPVDQGGFDGTAGAPYGGCSASLLPSGSPVGAVALVGLLGLTVRRRRA